jgi:hypothetical protein
MLQSATLQEWVSLLTQGLTLLLFLAGLVLGMWQLRRQKQGAQTEELAKIARARSVLRGLLQGSAFGLVTRAEEHYGAGQGEIKKSEVLANLLQLLPEDQRALFSAEELTSLIESGLASAKKIWGSQAGA